jgi:multidrug efflux system membrane fusion protein
MVIPISGRRRFPAYLLCSLLCVLTIVGCREEEKPPEVIRSIRWMRITASTTEQVRMISGTTKPVEQTALSFAVGGTVERVAANLGDRVKKGQVLAELDKNPFTLAVRDAQAAVSKARAIVAERRANFQRTAALYERDNASKADLDQARASFNSAESQVRAAEAQLGLAQRDLSKTVLRAPFIGTISMKQVEPYMEVRQGEALFTLDGETSGFEVRAAVPETMVIRLQAGDTADVVFPSLENRRVPGEISEIGPRSQTASTYPVTVKLTETFAELRAGMSVEVAFQFTAKTKDGEPIAEGLMVPLAALLIAPQTTYFVFLYDESSSTVKKTPVKVIALRDNDVLLEPHNLKAGDIIATAGVPFLYDGQKVNLMKEKKA